MDYRGQGAIEYLLIIAAAIIVVAIVIVAISGVTTNQPNTESVTDAQALLQCQVTCGYTWTNAGVAKTCCTTGLPTGFADACVLESGTCVATP